MTPEVSSALLERALAAVDRDRLRDLAVALVEVPSPTGHERPLAERAAALLAGGGVEARVQPLDDRQANAVGRVRGDGSGPALLLYAPIDTLTTGTEADLGVVGPELLPHMRPEAQLDGDLVTGLGAGNPKGHAACVVAAIEAVAGAAAATGTRLRGDLVAGLGAGGMPTNGPVLPGDERRATGQGAGCSFLLEQGAWPDAAVVAKPGWAVAWEEVGLAWFDLTVRGTHTYVGSRHRMPYRNAVAAAGLVAQRAEEWADGWAARHTSGLVAPQAVVGAVSGGWTRMPAVTPAACTLRLDVRLSPRTTPSQARREVEAFAAGLRETEGVEVDAEMVLAIPGGTTDRDHWVARLAREAWEAVEGCPHQDVTGTSGATDATILRTRGVPTVRVGMPKVPGPPSEDFALGMNTADVAEMERLTRLLVTVAVGATTRTLDELEGP